MQKKILNKLHILMLCILWVFIGAASGANSMPVSTSFSILADIVKNVGGDKVTVTPIIGVGQDVHDYIIKPSDLAKVQQSKILFLNGYNLESGWVQTLTNSYKGVIINTALNIKDPIYIKNRSGDIINNSNMPLIDPHAWNNPVIVIETYIPNISKGLCIVDPINCKYYRVNAAHYIIKLRELDQSIIKMLSIIDPTKRQAVITHDAFDYYARQYKINFIAAYGVSEDNVSAKNIASLEHLIRKNKVKVLFLENQANNKIMQEIANDVNVKIGGKLYADSLSNLGSAADTYIHMLQVNTETLVASWK